MASKPAILTVDDDPGVLRAVERDLRRRYGVDYRILRADSGPAALSLITEFGERGGAVALLLSDHRMPHMDGVEFLRQARELVPDAKRLLLTAYADTDAAIRAINDVDLDHYLMKPWDPPDERLYPVLDDLLDEWRGSYRPPFDGVRVVGDRWSPQSHRLKEFLGDNAVPYEWLDVESGPQARDLLGAEPSQNGGSLPLMVLPDGRRLANPSTAEVAEAIGLRTRATRRFYDLVVVGGGPAALAAAVYGASEGLDTVMIERAAPGGQAGSSSRIENYLGFPVGLSGADLTRRAVAQASRFGVEILAPQEVVGVRVEDAYRTVTLGDGSEVASHAMLLATGVQWRRLDVPGVARLSGAGVYYGAARTEAVGCTGETVYLVGGANSAGQAAMYFSRFAERVVMLVRGPSLTAGMSQYLIDQIAATPTIEVRTGCRVVEAHGDTRLEALSIEDTGGGEPRTEKVPASYLFLMIGAEPSTDWLAGVVARDARGFIPTGPAVPRDGSAPAPWPLQRDPYLLETSVPGIFAAGDVRADSVKRVASGVGEGSVAISFVHQYLARVAPVTAR
jgi:thioredoxin reductase (NADPH)